MTTRQVTTAQARRQIRPNTTAAHDRARWCRKELAHIRCEHTSDVRLGENLHPGRKETEAESVAHLCCRALGLDTQVYSDAYVLGWADGDMDLIKQCAETVLRVAKAILTDLTPAESAADVAAETTAAASVTRRRSAARSGAGRIRGRRRSAAGTRAGARPAGDKQ
jgi:hypothetical protein